jgi:hypothetical protein
MARKEKMIEGVAKALHKHNRQRSDQTQGKESQHVRRVVKAVGRNLWQKWECGYCCGYRERKVKP